MRILLLNRIPEIVYHGSTTQYKDSLNNIDVKYGRKDVDFGQGFYTTSVKSQAIEWAEGKAFGPHKPLLLTYTVDVDSMKVMKGLFFRDASNDWRKFVIENRMGINPPTEDYDWIYGHTADGKPALLVEQFRKGIITIEDFEKSIYPLEQPLFYYDQLFFQSNLSTTVLTKIKEEVL